MSLKKVKIAKKKYTNDDVFEEENFIQGNLTNTGTVDLTFWNEVIAPGASLNLDEVSGHSYPFNTLIEFANTPGTRSALFIYHHFIDCN